MTATYMGFPAVVESSEAVDANTIRVKLRFETPAERAARRRALLDEAAAWRTIGEWVETYPRRLTVEMVTGIACFIGGVGVVDAMCARLVAHGGQYNGDGDGGYRNSDYFAGVCLFLSYEAEDEAADLLPAGRAPRQKKGGRRHA